MSTRAQKGPLDDPTTVSRLANRGIGREDPWMLKALLDEGRLLGQKPQYPVDEDRVAA